jgi:CDP-diacylglycerol---serine O-phosphatidyltransferase
MKKHLPNILTLANLFTGCIGIVYVFNDNLQYAAYAIWIAAIFDFFDGFVARLLGVSSPIGKELDSLADMVTFGALPSFMLFKMMDGSGYELLPYLAFALALFSALRLAIFNVDTRQSTSFIGMPTPAAAFFVSGLPFWQDWYPELVTWPAILAYTVILSLLLVSPIKMLALKFTEYSFSKNWQRYLVVTVSVLLLVFLGTKALPLIIASYLLISILSSVLKLQ